MITLDIRGMDEVQRQLQRLAEDQIPYATMVALNNVAFKTKNALQAEIQHVFDKPTPWLIRQVIVEKAKKETLTAKVGTTEGIKYNKGTVYERILAPHIEGGSRRLRSSEHRLRNAGILPAGWYCVPAPDAPLDAYGNLPGSWWIMILSWLNALQWSSQGATQNRMEKISKRKNKLERLGVQVFAAIPNRARTRHLHPGIYLRQSKDGFKMIKAAILFVRSVSYQRRLDWLGVATKTSTDELPKEIAYGIERALMTAR